LSCRGFRAKNLLADDEKEAQPAARANGPERPWLILNVGQKMRFRLIITLLMFATSLAAADTTLRKMWASGAYKSASVPKEWRPSTIPSSERMLAAFERYSDRDGFSIISFLSRFGMPSRYLVALRKEDQDFLIYDLASGHAVALYVSKLPSQSFAAIAIIDSTGNLVKLIK
jgi:hypothetical protein